MQPSREVALGLLKWTPKGQDLPQLEEMGKAIEHIVIIDKLHKVVYMLDSSS